MKKIRFIFIIVFIAAVVFFYKNGMSGGVSVIRNWIHDRTDDTFLDEDTNELTGRLDKLLTQVEERISGFEERVNLKKAAALLSEEELEKAHGYYYQFLSESEASAYDSFESSCRSYLSEAYLPVMDFSEMVNAMNAFRNDHPEYYWLHDEILYRQWNGGIAQSASIPVPEDAPDIQNQIQLIAKELVEKASASCETEYDKYKYFFNYIIDNTEYGQVNEKRGQTIEGVFLDHKAVCGGYAAAYKYLCDLAGLKCAKVVGTAYNYDGSGRGLHAWNLIWIEEKPYWVDVTWGDPQFEGGSNSWDEGWRDYSNFCALDEDFFKTHRIDYKLGMGDIGSQSTDGQEKDYLTVSYPACDDAAYEYYHLNGFFFESSQEAQEYLAQQMREHSAQVQMKLSSSREYSEMISVVTNSSLMGQMAYDTGYSFTEYQYIPIAAFNTLVINFR